MTALALSPVLAAPRGDLAARYYEDALVRYEKSDSAGAIIQLRNALQHDSRLLAAYILLGKAYLEKAEPAAAEDALMRALQLGVDRSEVVIPLAQSYLDQGKYDVLLERLSPEGLSAALKGELLVLRGQANRELDQPREAANSFEQARTADSRSPRPLTALAALLLHQGDRAGAARAAEQAVALGPRDANAWNAHASVIHVAGQSAAALAAYAKALEYQPGHADARVARAALLLDLGRDAEAAAELDRLKQHHADDARGAYLRGVLASRKGDAASARDALQEVAKIVDAVPPDAVTRRPQLLLLGGLSHYGLDEHEKAKGYLQAYIKRHPGHPGARKLLAAIHASEGDAVGAISLLEPVLKASPNDYQALAVTASAYRAQRQYAKAAALLERATQAPGAPAALQTSYGLSLVGAGQEALALAHLARAFSKDPGHQRTGVALAVLHLKRKEPKLAADVLDGMLRRTPNDPVVLNLLGTARAASGDRPRARAAYEKVLAGNPRFTPALLNLARLDVDEGRTDVARGRLTALLARQPRNTQAMFELARVEDSAGRASEATRWLEKLLEQDKKNAGAWVRLVDAHLRNGDTERALAAAKDADLHVPETLAVMEALARAHAAGAEQRQARTVLNRMTVLAEYDGIWQQRIARLQYAVGNRDGALYSLEKALSGAPGFLPAEVLMTEIERDSGDLEKAEQRARRVIARHPNTAIGHRLLGDILLQKKRHSEAIAEYRAALSAEKTSDAALRLFRALIESGNTGKAVDFMESWAKDNPRDSIALRALGEAYLRDGRYGAARTTYESALKQHGDDAHVLNNLAHILLRQGDKAAVAYAEKAHRLAPDDPAVNDTLGWLYVQHGQTDKGIKHLRDARLRNPVSGDIRYHLAHALERIGRRDEARQELERALQDNATFESAPEARKLLQAIGR